MLKIRLQRVGKRGKAHFRVVLLEHTRRPKGSFQELLGSYDPHAKKLEVKKERIEYWKSKGAQVSPTVHNLLINYKVLTGEKVPSWKPKKKEAAATPAAA
jgi:small subunit ribosomal protein S16